MVESPRHNDQIDKMSLDNTQVKHTAVYLPFATNGFWLKDPLGMSLIKADEKYKGHEIDVRTSTVIIELRGLDYFMNHKSNA